MNGSMHTGFTGLINSQAGLDVESNNIANVNTTGFKSDRMSFGDLMYKSQGIGCGSATITTNKDFNVGNIKMTENDYDFAIKGDGFFTLSNGASEFYTRSGELQRGDTGYLENNNNLRVQGLAPTNTNQVTIQKKHVTHILTSTHEDDKQVSSLNIFSINYKQEMQDDLNYGVIGTEGAGLKSKQSKINDIESIIKALNEADSKYNNNPIDGTTPIDALYSVDFGTNSIDQSVNIDINGITYEQQFDTDNETTYKKLADKINKIEGIEAKYEDPNKISIKSLVKGNNVDLSKIVIDPGVNQTQIQIPEATTFEKGSGKALYDALLVDLQDQIKKINGKDDDVVVSIISIDKITSDTMFIKPPFSDILLNLDQASDTRPPVREYISHGTITRSGLGELEYDNNNIYMNDGDGKYLVGRLVPVVFTSNNGLEPMGDNIYRKTKDSGEPMVSKYTVEVDNKKIEMSNSNLANSLVNLMVFQRAFEANSKALTTSDEFLKAAINLVK